jgi:hypothetical protein
MNTNARRAANVDPRSLNSCVTTTEASKCNQNLTEATISRIKITPMAIIKDAIRIPIIDKRNTVRLAAIGEARQTIIKVDTETVTKTVEMTEPIVETAVKITTEEAETIILVASEETIDLFDLFPVNSIFINSSLYIKQKRFSKTYIK